MRLIVHLHRTTWYLIFAAIVILALLLSTARLLLPELHAYRGYFEDQLGQLLERPVKIGTLKAGLNGFRPEAVLNNVELIDPESHQPVLTLRTMRIELNLIDLITDGELTPRRFSVTGAALSIQTQDDGSITIAGLKPNDDPPTWLFKEGLFELLDSTVEWRDVKRKGPQRHFSDVDIRILNEPDGRHHITLDIAQPAETEQSLKIIIDYKGDLFQPNCCTGTLYLASNGLQLDQLTRDQDLFGFSITGSSAFRLWSQWQAGSLSQISGMVSLDQLTIRRQSGDQAQQLLEQMNGWFRLQISDDQWQLEADHLSLTRSNHQWPLTRFNLKVKRNPDDQSHTVQAAASHLRLDDIVQWIDQLALLDDKQREQLVSLNLEGELSDVELTANGSATTLDQLAFCSDFSKLGFNLNKPQFAITQLSGQLCGNQQQGMLSLNSEGGKLTMHPLSQGPLPIKRLEGTIQWQRQAESWLIESSELLLATPEINSQTDFQLQLPDSGASPQLQLQSDFADFDLTRIQRYLPIAAMRQGAINWLDRAFPTGHISHGTLLIHGPLNQLPFDNNEGVMQLRLKVDQLSLNYAERWPIITGIDGSVLINKRALTFDVDQAVISNNRISNITGIIPDLTINKPRLRVDGEAHGQLANGLGFLRNSPLNTRFEPFLQHAQLSGEQNLKLTLEIPIQPKPDNVVVDGTLQLDHASLMLTDRDIAITAIRGALHFDQNGIHAERLSGSLFDIPITLSLTGQTEKVTAQITGESTIEQLQTAYSSPYWRYASGSLPFQLDLEVTKSSSTNDLPVELTFHSDLSGVELTLPEPFSKTASQRRRLDLTLSLNQTDRVPLTIRYGDNLTAALLFSERNQNITFERGTLLLGKRTATVPKNSGLGLIIELNKINLDQWLEWYAAADTSTSGTISASPLFTSINWRSDALLLNNIALGNFSLQLKRSDNRWRGTIASRYLQGSIDYSGQTIRLKLDHLTIPQSISTKHSPKKSSSTIDPRTIPPIKLQSQRLKWHGRDLGSVTLTTKQRDYGMQIEQLKVSNFNYLAELSGDWKHTGFYDSSRIDGRIAINDFGLFLASVGKPGVIQQTATELRFSLSWPGPPYRPSLKTIKGDLNLELDKGRLLTVEPGVGRLFGLFNIDGLKRMLLFDFSHLLDEGLAYDEIKGSIALADGDADVKRITIDGVPARIELTGRIGLDHKTIDQTVTVTSKTGTAVGVAVILARGLTADLARGIAQRQYRITGQWDSPIVIRVPISPNLLQRGWSALK